MSEITIKNIIRYVRENFWLLVRYGISGLMGVIANLFVFALLVEMYRVWYLLAAIIGFVFAYAVTFSMHKWWTFTATSKERTVFQSVLYLGSALGTLAVNAGLLYVLVEYFFFWPVLGQFIALFISAFFSFIFTSQVTFHADEERWNALVRWVDWRYGHLSVRTWFWPVMLLVLLACFVSARYFLVPVTYSSDAAAYIESAKFISNEPAVFEGQRYLKPLAPAMVAVIAPLFGVAYPSALLIQALVMYLALALAVYWFGAVFFKDRKAGILLALLVTLSYPMLRYGLDTYTETAAWTWYFLALGATLLWYRSPATRWLWVAALVLLCGLLTKEYAVLAGVVLGFSILFQPTLSLWHKVHALLQAGSLTLIPWFLWQWHVYSGYGYSYFDWLAVGAAEEAYQTMYTVTAIGKSAFVLLLAAWLLVPLGLYFVRHFSLSQKRFLQFLTLPSFGFVLWGYVSSRLFFSLVPLIAPLAIHGLRRVCSFRISLLVLLCIGVVNLGLVWFSFNPDIRALLDAFAYESTIISTE